MVDEKLKLPAKSEGNILAERLPLNLTSYPMMMMVLA